MLHTIEQFHRQAVNKNLSAGAILLWQQLYFTMERKNQFADLEQSTAVLTAQLKVTRQGLAVMRHTLVERGFLTVRVDEHQRTFYTLMIEGKTVGDKKTGMGNPSPTVNDSCANTVGMANDLCAMTAPTMDNSCANTVGEGLVRPSAPMPFPLKNIAMSMDNGMGNPSPTADDSCAITVGTANDLCAMTAPTMDNSCAMTVGEGSPFPLKNIAMSMDNGMGNPSPTANDSCAITVGMANDSCTNTVGMANDLCAMTAAHPSGDIILTNRIRPYIDTFCDKFGPAMKGDLIQWAEMRRKNGWTLTLWGLEELFKKLITLSAGNAIQMAQIVAQSVKKRWKGFFALKVTAKPSGEKLRRQEEPPYQKPWEKPAPWQKCKPEGRDLSFLEI